MIVSLLQSRGCSRLAIFGEAFAIDVARHWSMKERILSGKDSGDLSQARGD